MEGITLYDLVRIDEEGRRFLIQTQATLERCMAEMDVDGHYDLIPCAPAYAGVPRG